MTNMRRHARALLAAPLLWAVASAGLAQGFPSRPITLNVGFTAGGSTDIAARLVAQKLSTRLGQPVVVQTKPGAAGMLAAEAVAKAPPDGYQLLVLAIGTVTSSTLANKPTFSIDKDLTPISFSGITPLVLVTSPQLPANNLNEFIDLARSQPGKMSFASDGIGAVSHLAGELFNKLASVKTVHVPYKGGAEGVLAVASGQVELNIPTLTSALSMIQSGKVRALAVSGPKRSPLLPAVPTLDELGLKGFDLVAFIALMGPPGMPRPIVDKLHAAMVEVVNDSEFRAASARQAMDPQSNTPEQLAEYLRTLKDTVTRLGRESSIKLE